MYVCPKNGWMLYVTRIIFSMSLDDKDWLYDDKDVNLEKSHVKNSRVKNSRVGVSRVWNFDHGYPYT